MAALTELELAVLAFEHGRWRFIGAKEQAVADCFGMTLTRYTQVLVTILDKPEALVAEPVLVNRLRRLRTHRRELRTTR